MMLDSSQNSSKMRSGKGEKLMQETVSTKCLRMKRIKVGCLLCIPLLLTAGIQSLLAQPFSAQVVDSAGRSFVVDQLYIEYQWGYFERNHSGVDQYRTDRLRSYTLLLQEKNTDRIITVPFGDIDSIQIVSDKTKKLVTKNQIDIFTVDGQLIKFRLNYQPGDILSGYLNDDPTNTRGVFSLKRWIKGWTRPESERGRERYEADLNELCSVKFLHAQSVVPGRSQSRGVKEKIERLEQEKKQLKAIIREIEDELRILKDLQLDLD